MNTTHPGTTGAAPGFMGAAIIIVIIPLLLFIVTMLMALVSALSWSVAIGVVVALTIAGSAFAMLLKAEMDEEKDIEEHITPSDT